jgi:hypothetical protein
MPARESGPRTLNRNETCLHLEQMNEPNWYVDICELKFKLHVREGTGAVQLRLYDGQETEFGDKRSG